MAVLPFKTNPYHVAGVADFSQREFWIAVGAILFNPIYWNLVAQNEYRRKTLTKLLGNRPYLGCYLLGASIFLLGILRDHLYNQALAKQPVNAVLALPAVHYLGAGLFIVGQVLVLSSMYALGITGTYLGDYFGILMDAVVTGFPFNLVPDPMYAGSTLSFVGVALWFAKPAGLILSALLAVVYLVALRFEGPFTAHIYKVAAANKKRKQTVARRSSTSSTATKKRSASTASSRRSSTAKAKDAAEAATTTATPAKKTTAAKKTTSTPRKKKDSSAASTKSASSDVETTTPAKRGRKKKASA